MSSGPKTLTASDSMVHNHGVSDRIVVGVDQSEMSQRAFKWAVQHARRTGARVVAVHAWHFPFHSTAGAPVFAPEEGEHHAREVLEAVVDSVDASGLYEPVEQMVVFDGTVDALLDAAEGAALLVVGTRGRGTLASAALGSVSHEVARRARCPVVIVPLGYDS